VEHHQFFLNHLWTRFDHIFVKMYNKIIKLKTREAWSSRGKEFKEYSIDDWHSFNFGVERTFPLSAWRQQVSPKLLCLANYKVPKSTWTLSWIKNDFSLSRNTDLRSHFGGHRVEELAKFTKIRAVNMLVTLSEVISWLDEEIKSPGNNTDL